MRGARAVGQPRLISPRRTLISCGNSSRLRLRSQRPTRVLRGSLARVQTGPLASASRRIERNLSMSKTRAVVPHALLSIEHGPPGASGHRKANGEEKRRESDERDTRNNEIEAALGYGSPTKERGFLEADYRQSIEALDAALKGITMQQVGHDLDVHDAVLELDHDFSRRRRIHGRDSATRTWSTRWAFKMFFRSA